MPGLKSGTCKKEPAGYLPSIQREEKKDYRTENVFINKKLKKTIKNYSVVNLFEIVL